MGSETSRVPDDDAVFRQEGEYWTIACDGRLIRLRHSKGLGYLSRLVRKPLQRVHVDDLVGIPASQAPRSLERGQPPGRGPSDRRRVAVTKALRTALRKIAAHDHVLGELLGSAVHTGTFCSYVPGPGCPPSWPE